MLIFLNCLCAVIIKLIPKHLLYPYHLAGRHIGIQETAMIYVDITNAIFFIELHSLKSISYYIHSKLIHHFA